MIQIPVCSLEPALISSVSEKLKELFQNQHLFHSQKDERTIRDTIQYGYNFFKLEQGDLTYAPIPEFLHDLGNEILAAFGFENVLPFDNVIISVYESGYHLEPHEDTDIVRESNNSINLNQHYTDRMENRKEYAFAENIFGVVIVADGSGRFYILHDPSSTNSTVSIEKAETVFELNESPGVAFMLSGEARRRPFLHGVSEVCDRRVSVTFRHVLLDPHM